jgi:hypothetical protein
VDSVMQFYRQDLPLMPPAAMIPAIGAAFPFSATFEEAR